MARGSTNVASADGATITSITDSTGGSATSTIDDTTASVKDDLATLAAKINAIIVILRNAGLIV